MYMYVLYLLWGMTSRTTEQGVSSESTACMRSERGSSVSSSNIANMIYWRLTCFTAARTAVSRSR